MANCHEVSARDRVSAIAVVLVMSQLYNVGFDVLLPVEGTDQSGDSRMLTPRAVSKATDVAVNAGRKLRWEPRVAQKRPEIITAIRRG